MLLMFLFISCTKTKDEKETTGKVTFYAINLTSRWDLILDGTDKGSIKSTSQMPVCGDPLFINVTLSIGTHNYKLKSLDGYASGPAKDFSVSSGCHQFRCMP